MIVSMLASSTRAIVSSRRSCWVRAISNRGVFPLRRAGLQEPSGLDRLPVAGTELALAEYDHAVDARGDDGLVVAVHHARQVAVERHLLLVVAVHRVVEAGRVYDDEVGAVAFSQRARRQAEPFRD